MTLLAVERIKLFTTRSPWWCALITLVITIGFGALIAGTAPDSVAIDVGTTEFGYNFGIAVIMVLAALSVTTEYRFGTMRTTFQAVPHRGSVLAAKAAVVGLLALVIGELGGFGAWALASVLRPNNDLGLNTAAEWTNVAGVGVLFAIAAIIAVAVGILIRHSAGAIALLLIYSLAVESLVSLIPTVGPNIHKWLPFNVADKFLRGSPGAGADGPPPSDAVLSPGWALAYFAGFALVLMAVAIGVAKKRDA
ncbi:ABC transporter permease [Amycolatopsis sp. H20-H5]|uniref:ABC transporter permease n=1 Tax=Amycolatopsis sp. H20-H5 TaxID=3046309 RepID=UPI002DBC367B|nr:ABC transporter permease [Amycolatopsis sp. H20-H5]MEC3982151.1 ABC transporter permease [Amycolatopsis sp. H20-H5]